MSDIVFLNNNEDLIQFYIQLFTDALHAGDHVLYVGYEEDDLLLPIIAQNKVDILAVDRENRSNRAYDNVRYIQTDFKNIEKTIGDTHFEWVIFSFMLHENPPVIHQKFIDIAQSISDNIVIIEPLPRQDVDGVEFEKELSEFYAKRNQVKRYHSAEYWQKTLAYNPDTDKYIVLKRKDNDHEKTPLMIHGKKILLSLQDIVIFICKK